jgi:hypothetical protein
LSSPKWIIGLQAIASTNHKHHASKPANALASVQHWWST